MELTPKHIFLFLISIYFFKQLDLDINLGVNMLIFGSAVYYYYYEHQKDTKTKSSLSDLVNSNDLLPKKNTDKIGIGIPQTEPVLGHLEKLKLFSEKHGTVNTDIVREVVLYSDKVFSDRSVFYREQLNQLLEGISYRLSDKEQIDEFHEIKENLIRELDRKVEIKDPLSFHQFKGRYSVY